MAIGGSGEWGSTGYGTYTIPQETNLKKYYLNGEYTDVHFGTNQVIVPVEGSGENDRFYVMALENFDSSTHYWYSTAYGNLDSANSINMSKNDFASEGAEPTGKINTDRMIEAWNEGDGRYGDRNDNDIWGVIQTPKSGESINEIKKGWFIPSKSEWAAFGVAFNIGDSNYSTTYGLDRTYWTSSQSRTSGACGAYCYYGSINDDSVTDLYCIRLATTF